MEQKLIKKWLKKNKPKRDIRDFTNNCEQWQGNYITVKSYSGLGDYLPKGSRKRG